MQKLVDALLSYGLIGQKQQVEKVDLKKTLKEVLDDLQCNTEASDPKVTLGYLPVVYGLRNELHQLFQNLVSNCLKFKKNGNPCEMEIWAENKDEYYHFRVKDNGIGIAADHQQKIFELFKRLHNNKTIGGTGIGLAQCAKIVDLHDGEMWVESEPDCGSIFHFTMKKHPSINDMI